MNTNLVSKPVMAGVFLAIALGLLNQGLPVVVDHALGVSEMTAMSPFQKAIFANGRNGLVALIFFLASLVVGVFLLDDWWTYDVAQTRFGRWWRRLKLRRTRHRVTWPAPTIRR